LVLQHLGIKGLVSWGYWPCRNWFEAIFTQWFLGSLIGQGTRLWGLSNSKSVSYPGYVIWSLATCVLVLIGSLFVQDYRKLLCVLVATDELVQISLVLFKKFSHRGLVVIVPKWVVPKLLDIMKSYLLWWEAAVVLTEVGMVFGHANKSWK
jgi:hypothetical protein